MPDAEALAGADLAEVLGRGAQMANLGGEPARTVALAREAIASLDPAAGPIRAAVMHERLGRALWAQGESAASLAEHERAMAIMPADPPTAERARVLAGYGQILMLLDQWQASRDRCQEAIDIALQVGAREAEGHARNTLGLDLAAQGDCERAVAALEAALAIAIEVGNVDEVGRAHVNRRRGARLSAAWRAGRPRRSSAASRLPKRFGIPASYGAYIRHNGIQVNFELGPMGPRRSARGPERGVPVGTGSPPTATGSAAGCRSSSAERGHRAAKAQLDRLAELLDGVPVEAQYSGNYHAAKAELALWEGRPSTLAIARRARATRGRPLAVVQHPALRVAAWAAATRRTSPGAPRPRATEDAVATGVRITGRGARPLIAGMPATSRAPAGQRSRRREADAEDRRLDGRPMRRPGRRRATLGDDSAARTSRPMPAGARARRSSGTGDKAAAAAAAPRSPTRASALGARPLREAIEALARGAPGSTSVPDVAHAGSTRPPTRSG